MYYNLEFEHYGVKGMKWGRRKAERIKRQGEKNAAKERANIKKKYGVDVTLENYTISASKSGIKRMQKLMNKYQSVGLNALDSAMASRVQYGKELIGGTIAGIGLTVAVNTIAAVSSNRR